MHFDLWYYIYHVTLFLQLLRLKLQILAMFSIYTYFLITSVYPEAQSSQIEFCKAKLRIHTYYIYLFDLGIIIVVWLDHFLGLWMYFEGIQEQKYHYLDRFFIFLFFFFSRRTKPHKTNPTWFYGKLSWPHSSSVLG